MELSAGSSFAGYLIEGALGRGGMAAVYRAYEPSLDRRVALKVLPAALLHDESFVARFHREARLAARLEHPHVVPIHAHGIEQGRPWMALRLVSGGSLADLLRSGQLDRARTVGILRDVADALDYAHHHGVIHRDVKPQNILLDERGRAYLADFGIARMLESPVQITATGMVQGTPAYMSPEQASGGTLGPACDVYALGVVAYECLTGRVPFTGPTPVSVLLKHVSEPPPMPSPDEVPPRLTGALRRCLAKTPSERWPSPGSFVAALEGRATGDETTARVPAATGEAAPPARARGTTPGAGRSGPLSASRWAVGAVVVTVAALAISGLGLWWVVRHGPSRSPGGQSAGAAAVPEPASAVEPRSPAPRVDSSEADRPAAVAAGKTAPEDPVAKSPSARPGGAPGPPPRSASSAGEPSAPPVAAELRELRPEPGASGPAAAPLSPPRDRPEAPTDTTGAPVAPPATELVPAPRDSESAPATDAPAPDAHPVPAPASAIRVFCAPGLEPRLFTKTREKDVLDSVADLRRALADRDTLELVDSPARADAVIVVLERGRKKTLGLPGMRQVRVRVTAGPHSIELVGQDSSLSFNTWKGAARGVVKDAESWLRATLAPEGSRP